jgi:fumarate hydratase class I
MTKLKESLLELIKSTSTKLPKDITDVISQYCSKEKSGTPAKYAMDIIKENFRLAEEIEQPICQDTGSIIFFVKVPKGFDQVEFIKEAKEAVVEATEKGYLRQNSVDPLTGKNSGNNLGPGSPQFHFEQWNKDEADIRLILKGGGCENVGIQYSLPNAKLDAQRNIDGVRKCIIDAALQAQGKGCAPGVLGVCIGGDRSLAYVHSKEQLLRKLDDKNPNQTLAELETEVVQKANGLGIGPMGFGGKTTLFGCKIGFLNRLPASYFVTISYMCWAYRRQGVVLDIEGEIKTWLY